MSTVTDRLPPKHRFDFSSEACASDTFAVVRLDGVEAISQPYRFELLLVSGERKIDLDKVLAANALLNILAPDDAQRLTPYAGMLAEFEQLHSLGGFTFYRAVLVPRVWRLSLYRNSEVYLHEQSIPQIITVLLQKARLGDAANLRNALRTTYRERSYICQYQETPLDFISRWMEHEGIYYVFEQVNGLERMVLLDDKGAQAQQALAVRYRSADELDTGLAPDSMHTFVCRSRPLPQHVVLQDFNHRRAGSPLRVQAQVSSTGFGDELIYGENFRDEAEGQRYADIRAQELRCEGRVFHGEGTAVGLRSGGLIELSSHYREDFDGSYLITAITHRGSQAGALLAGLKTPYSQGGGSEIEYGNSFVALPSDVQFRPARRTPKPRVAGALNATIDGEGSGKYAELDKFGQYKVQVPFDSTDKAAAKGSARIRMASPYAGSEHGMHFPLHKGTEVMLAFADGDPDRPTIVGAVPDSLNPSVVNEKNAANNYIRTAGGNTIQMNDTAGSEALWLHSPGLLSTIGIGHVGKEVPNFSGKTVTPENWEADESDGTGLTFLSGGGKREYVATKAEELFHGTKFDISLGSSTGVSAGVKTDASAGCSVGVSLSAGVDWKLALPPFKTVAAIQSLGIDDNESVSFKAASGGTSAVDALKFGAGAVLDPNYLATTTHLGLMRAAVAAYVAGNLATQALLSEKINKVVGEGGVGGGFTAAAQPVANVAFVALMQGWARVIAGRLEALSMASQVEMDKDGIRHVSESTDRRAELDITPDAINLRSKESGATRGEFSLRPGSLQGRASETASLTAKRVSLEASGIAAGPTISADVADTSIQLAAGSSDLTLKSDSIVGVASKISLGFGQTVMNPEIDVYFSQRMAAMTILTRAEDSYDSAKRALKNVGSEPLAALAATRVKDAAWAALQAARSLKSELDDKYDKAKKVLMANVNSGLKINGVADTQLNAGPATIKLATAQIALELGSANLKLGPAGLSGDGVLIKLG